MREVCRSSLGVLKSVFNTNDDNVHYYKLMKNLFQGQVLNLEFAKPVVQNAAGFIVWRSKSNGVFKKFTELQDPDLSNELSGMAQNALVELESILKSYKETEDFFKKITEVPSEDSIFYVEEPEGVKIILTEWGFYYDEARQSQGILKKVFPKALQSLIIYFKSRKGIPIPGVSALILENDVKKTYVSDSQGCVKLNNVSRGSHLSVESPNGQFRTYSTILDNSDDFNIIVDREVELSFKVENEQGAPVPNRSFSFVSDNLGELNYRTDSFGMFKVLHPEANGVFKILSEKGYNLFENEIPSEDEFYPISVDSQKEELDEIEYEEEVYHKGDNVEIELLNHKRKPIANHAVDFYGKNGKSSYVTNENGKFTVIDLIAENDYAIFLEYKKTDWKKDFSHKVDTNHYSFVVNKRKFFWWWLPVLLFFLFFFLIPFKVNHTYTVLDADTKKPLESALVSSASSGNIQVLANTYRTDAEGKLKLNYGKYTLARQLFKHPVANITVDKVGYNRASAAVPLGFFKPWQSKVYLDKYGGLSGYLPCNGGESYDEGGQQSKKFDLGQANSTFLFEFYNDTQLDIISVYCEDGQLLFRLNETTDTDYFADSEEIYSPCRFIEVRVDGESNWGIKVNCPDEY